LFRKRCSALLQDATPLFLYPLIAWTLPSVLRPTIGASTGLVPLKRREMNMAPDQTSRPDRDEFQGTSPRHYMKGFIAHCARRSLEDACYDSPFCYKRRSSAVGSTSRYRVHSRSRTPILSHCGPTHQECTDTGVQQFIAD
jgi:hypothetical protein